jgi:hypothetical protein
MLGVVWFCRFWSGRRRGGGRAFLRIWLWRRTHADDQKNGVRARFDGQPMRRQDLIENRARSLRARPGGYTHFRRDDFRREYDAETRTLQVAQGIYERLTFVRPGSLRPASSRRTDQGQGHSETGDSPELGISRHVCVPILVPPRRPRYHQFAVADLPCQVARPHDDRHRNFGVQALHRTVHDDLPGVTGKLRI